VKYCASRNVKSILRMGEILRFRAGFLYFVNL